MVLYPDGTYFIAERLEGWFRTVTALD
jgi:hypothetical protein